MNQFIQRVANYVANEIIIKGLAHNKTFQKFALRTDQQFREVNKMTSEKITKTVEELAKTTGAEGGGGGGAAGAAGGPPKPPLRGFPGFVSCFFKEIRKDLGLGS